MGLTTSSDGPFGLERLGQVGPEFFRVFEADGQPEQAFRDAVSLPAMPALEARFDPAERGLVPDHTELRLDVPGGIAGHVEGDDAAEAGVPDLVDARVLFEAPGQLSGGLCLPADADFQGLEPV